MRAEAQSSVVENPLNSCPDNELAERLRLGELSCFGSLFHRYRESVLQHLIGLMRDRHLAEDALIETFRSLYQHRESFDASKNFKGWLYAIAENTGKSILRKKARWDSENREPDALEKAPSHNRRNTSLDPQPKTVLDLLVRKEEEAQVMIAIENLSGDYRECLLLRFQGKKNWEIAKILNRSAPHIGLLVHQAVHKLRKRFQERD